MNAENNVVKPCARDRNAKFDTPARKHVIRIATAPNCGSI